MKITTTAGSFVDLETAEEGVAKDYSEMSRNQIATVEKTQKKTVV